MNFFVFGIHGTGKSTKVVELTTKIKPQKVYLLAADPYQKDDRTGKLVFPENYIRIGESILEDSSKHLRANSVIIVDDATVVRRKWKQFENLLATPRQSACDFFLTFHSFDLCMSSLFGYANIVICFRTASGVPLGARWGLKKQMDYARKYIVEYGNIHSYYITNNTKGTIKIVL